MGPPLGSARRELFIHARRSSLCAGARAPSAAAGSGRQRQPLVILPALEVVVEKVAVKNGLHRAGSPHCGRGHLSGAASGLRGDAWTRLSSADTPARGSSGRSSSAGTVRDMPCTRDVVSFGLARTCAAHTGATHAPQKENVMPRQVVHVPRVLQHHLRATNVSVSWRVTRGRQHTRQLRQNGNRLQVNGERPQNLRRVAQRQSHAAGCGAERRCRASISDSSWLTSKARRAAGAMR